jgi:hypothetical protein
MSVTFWIEAEEKKRGTPPRQAFKGAAIGPAREKRERLQALLTRIPTTISKPEFSKTDQKDRAGDK